MADLDPMAWPAPTDTMLQLEPSNGLRGPDFLDRETIASFRDAVAQGVFKLNPDWAPAISSLDNARLEQSFLEKLRSSRLGPASPVLYHRRVALFEAIKEAGAASAVPGFGLGVHNVTKAIGNLETWLEGKRQELEHAGFTDEALARQLTLIRPDILAAMLGVDGATLSRWRNSNQGPHYARLSARTVAYPAVAVSQWLTDLIAQ